jgi:hypothetical protein
MPASCRLPVLRRDPHDSHSAIAQIGGRIIGYLRGVRCRLQFVDEKANGMRRAWAMAKGGLAALALVEALGAAPAAPAAAQEEGRTVAGAPSRKVVRTERMRVPADLFEQNAVFFKRALVKDWKSKSCNWLFAAAASSKQKVQRHLVQ